MGGEFQRGLFTICIEMYAAIWALQANYVTMLCTH